MNGDIYQTLFDSTSQGIIILDELDMITQVNGSAARILRKGPQELVGSSLLDIFPSLSGRFFNQELDQVETLCAISKQGEEIVLALSSIPLEDIPPQKRAIIMRDVTASQASDQLRNYFLANITHEFRTPLSAIKASVELMMESLGDASQSELEQLLRSIHYSVAGLQTLIDNLLESASMESGHFRIYRQEVRLNEVIGEAVRVMAPLLQRRDQGLQIEMDWSIPPLPLDPTRITQVIVNLLSNASKYSPTGKGIRIKVVPTSENQLKLAIIDQGAGLTLRERETLFKKFLRLSDRTGEQFGVGLGLSVVKTIVEAHDGKVGVDENPEGGSVFWFTLPMKTAAEISI